MAVGISHTIHQLLVKTALFLFAGVVEKSRDTANLRRFGGVIESAASTDLVVRVASTHESGSSAAGEPTRAGIAGDWGS